MTHDPRCCGSGTCIVDLAGRCWCGQQWDGNKMSNPTAASLDDTAHRSADQAPLQPDTLTDPARAHNG